MPESRCTALPSAKGAWAANLDRFTPKTDGCPLVSSGRMIAASSAVSCVCWEAAADAIDGRLRSLQQRRRSDKPSETPGDLETPRRLHESRARELQNLSISNFVSVVCWATPGELANSHATACSAKRFSAEAPSTGTMTLNCRNAASLAV